MRLRRPGPDRRGARMHPGELPPIIASYWYSIDWDVEALWQLDLPTERVPLGTLTWHLDVPVWPDEAGKPYNATPRAVLDSPESHPREYRRISAADLSYPIEVFPHRGRLMILDGIHRLAQAYRDRRPDIAARRVPDWAVRAL